MSETSLSKDFDLSARGNESPTVSVVYGRQVICHRYYSMDVVVEQMMFCRQDNPEGLDGCVSLSGVFYFAVLNSAVSRLSGSSLKIRQQMAKSGTSVVAL